MHKVLLQNLSSDFETLKKTQRENSYGRKARKMDRADRRDPKQSGKGTRISRMEIHAGRVAKEMARVPVG